MLKKHYTLTFIYNRFKQKIYEIKNPDTPWMTSQSIKLLDQLITKDDNGVEYGSGRSTFWFAQRCKHLTSFEHNEIWFEIVNKKLSLLRNLNVIYKLKELNDNPLNSEYYKSIDSFKDLTLDFVIVDGKYRDIVALKAINKLKMGGLLILDNAERYLPNNLNVPESISNDMENVEANWGKFINKVEKWRKIWTTNGVTTTLLLIKTT